jgi:hypothetical protein
MTPVTFVEDPEEGRSQWFSDARRPRPAVFAVTEAGDSGPAPASLETNT